MDGRARARRRFGGRAWRRAVLYAALWGAAALYAVPIVWMVLVSLRTPGESSSAEAPILPGGPLARVIAQGAANYAAAWSSPQADFPVYLRNSVLIALAWVVGATASSAMAAYGFSRVAWRGRDAMFLVVLATMTIPQAVVLVPQYVLFRELGLIGTLAPLWLPGIFAGAFSVFLLRQFFRTIPRELDEAARIDGCSHWGIFRRVILPLSGPALAAAALFQFVAAWNDFLAPLVFLHHQRHYTLSLGLHLFMTQHGGTPWNLVMAFGVLVAAPVLVVYALFTRAFVEGVATQGLKE